MLGDKVSRVLSLLVAASFIFGGSASALGAGPVISHVKTGDSSLASSEYIAIYNNSDQAVDISGWCVVYASSSDATKTNLACLTPPDSKIALMLQPFGHIRLSTNEFKQSLVSFLPDALFSSGLSGTSGHVRLLDKNKNEMDKIGWGSAASPEIASVASHSSGYLLVRKSIAETLYLQDTNNNFQDFSQSILADIPASGVYEQQLPEDVCPNLDELQEVIPNDYFLDENSNCIQDQCDNLEGLQSEIPPDFESLDGENCQKKIINLESSVLLITEMLPNVSSTDEGKEFIEIYNPNQKPVQLEGYQLFLGPSYSKSHLFAPQLINPLSFTKFSDLMTGLTLPNSSASLKLVAPAGNTVSEAKAYENPKDDQAWALIDDVWQYTDNPTPGLPNMQNDREKEKPETEKLADCGPGKYRNPETSRCRNIQSGDVELKPCDPGQVRNPETNRCRSAAAASSLVPCKEGQERNPETNRCRNIVSTASVLKQCEPGQERNPETNRCRKVASLGASTLADVKDIPASPVSKTNWWVIAGAISAASVYGIYEWKSEIFRNIRKLKIKT